jgi:hypothetical protein
MPMVERVGRDEIYWQWHQVIFSQRTDAWCGDERSGHRDHEIVLAGRHSGSALGWTLAPDNRHRHMRD